MKFIITILFFLTASVAEAIPVSYAFEGRITYISDATDSPWVDDDQIKDALPQVKDWLSIGDSYSGTVTLDTDQVIFDTKCNNGIYCGGLISFRMMLGERLVSYNSPYGFQFVDIGFTGKSFTSWGQIIGTFDSFHFTSGSIQGVDSAYFEGFKGSATQFIRVSEPSTLPPLLLGLLIFTITKSRRTRILNNMKK